MSIAAERGNDVGEIVEALRTAKRVSAVCHENPDADTIGAAVAVCIIAERLGAEAEIVSADGFPPAVRLPAARGAGGAQAAARAGSGRHLRRRHAGAGRPHRHRGGGMVLARAVLNVDHHISSNVLRRPQPGRPQGGGHLPGAGAGRWTRWTSSSTRRWQPPCWPGSCATARASPTRRPSGETLRAAARLVDAGAPMALDPSPDPVRARRSRPSRCGARCWPA